MSKAKSATEVLKAAKWILENIGWIQGADKQINSLGVPTGFCSVGAIRAVETTTAFEYDSPYLDRDSSIRGQAFRRLCKVMNGRAILFNDVRGRTKQQILKAFDQAIKEVSDE